MTKNKQISICHLKYYFCSYLFTSYWLMMFVIWNYKFGSKVRLVWNLLIVVNGWQTMLVTCTFTLLIRMKIFFSAVVFVTLNSLMWVPLNTCLIVIILSKSADQVNISQGHDPCHWGHNNPITKYLNNHGILYIFAPIVCMHERFCRPWPYGVVLTYMKQKKSKFLENYWNPNH